MTTTPNIQNCSSQSNLTRSIGPSVRACQLNIEGISQSKIEYLARMLHKHSIDVLALQETHVPDTATQNARLNIPNFTLVAAVPSQVHGIATYVKEGICNVKVITCKCEADISNITISIGAIKIVNIYKPPNAPWPPETLPVHPHPTVYLGDFNSHHTNWRYTANDSNGIQLNDWIGFNDLYLSFDAKEKGTFHSARWNSDTNPDLCIVTQNSDQIPLTVQRQVLPFFPRSQHRPCLVNIGTVINVIESLAFPRWNLKKANWTKYAEDLDSSIRLIPPTRENYDRFAGLIIATAKKHIPRGVRKNYIPCWNEECERLASEFEETGNHEIAKDLMAKLNSARQERWSTTVENLDFTHSSRKAWGLLRRLGGASHIPANKPSVEPADIADRIVSLSKAPADKAFTKDIRKKLQNQKQIVKTIYEDHSYTNPITINEVNKAINHLKPNRAAGFDGVYAEFLTKAGQKTRQWLATFYTSIIDGGAIPNSFKKAKVIAILKPNKPSDKPESYRPISLLSVCYKLMERLILNRVENHIENRIPDEQAGFRKGRSCTDQVLAITTHIESGFQECTKTSAVFIDLTAAYDTVWRHGMLYKFLRAIPNIKLFRLLNDALSNRSFQVHLNGRTSSFKKLSNGLPQGSVLAPLLFNLYISDLPPTRARKFVYADDILLTYQHKTMKIAENILNEDMDTLSKYFSNWRLTPSTAKTEATCFHLNNHLAKNQLNIKLNGKRIEHNDTPKYLGVTLDRTLSYKQHLTKTAAKLNTRNNIIQKLAGTSWGATANCLRSAALGLVFSTAEYCAPIWLNSPHIKKVDVALNTTMRTISGTIKTTPTQLLPYLSHIAPPALRRQHGLLRERNKIMSNHHLPCHKEFSNDNPLRLGSRKPPHKTSHELAAARFDLDTAWKSQVINAPNEDIFPPLHDEVPLGFGLPRKSWCNLNRIRSGHGRCASAFYKWGISESPECQCGAPEQTVEHIWRECSLTKYNGELSDIRNFTPAATRWLNTLNL